MTSSDIIAIVAIVMSALVSIVSASISYLNNKQNISAKRSEIALEKRMEAFRDVVEKLGGLSIAISFLKGLLSPKIKVPKKTITKATKILTDAGLAFMVSFQQNGVFFPLHISKIIRTYQSMSSVYMRVLENNIEGMAIDSKNLDNWLSLTVKYEADIVSEIQKFIGYK
jgi:hypothetical protein